MTRIGFKTAFDRFIEDTKAVEEAILTAKKHPFGSNVELFEEGNYQVSFNTEDGPFCCNCGFIMLVEQLTALEYDTDPEACLNNVIQELRDDYETDIIDRDATELQWRIDEVKMFIEQLEDKAVEWDIKWDKVKLQLQIDEIKSIIKELKDNYEYEIVEWDDIELQLLIEKIELQLAIDESVI